MKKLALFMLSVAMLCNVQALFGWGATGHDVVAAIAVGFASATAVMIVALAEVDTTRITTLIVAVIAIPQYIVEGMYILYLKRAASIFAEKTDWLLIFRKR